MSKPLSKDEQLNALREAWQQATSAEERAQITEEATSLKNKAWCYQCQQFLQTEEHYPFCSKRCHEAWAGANYGSSEKRGKDLTIREMQERLEAMGKSPARDASA